MYNDRKGTLIQDKGFPRGEREKWGREDDARHKNEVSLEKNLDYMEVYHREDGLYV